MSENRSLERSRQLAAAEARRLLGISELTQEALFELAGEVLGHARAQRCLELAFLAPLSRRSIPTSAVAQLIVGTRAVGPEWWSRMPETWVADLRRVHTGTPDALLTVGHDVLNSDEDGGSCLAALANWVADDAADAQWGRPIGYVDLNDPQADDRVVLPEHAKPGDRFVASFDPGGRVWVDVVERADSIDPLEKGENRQRSIGSRLAEHKHHDSAGAGWAWAIATDVGPVRLPGEIAGSPNDPFTMVLDSGIARQLFGWAADHGATVEELGTMWETKADLWSARFRLELAGRDAAWWQFGLAASAALDDDTVALDEALSRLDRGW